MKEIFEYIRDILVGMWRLVQGMYITILNFFRPKVTEPYPENRGKHVYFDRFRALLTMPHDADNHHKCTACGICMNNCPNGTITVISKTEDNPETGRPRKVLDRYVYNVGSCIFCDLCTSTCPFDAIEFSNEFEHSVFTKERLQQQLNRPGSSLAPKPVPAPAAGVSEAATGQPGATGASSSPGAGESPSGGAVIAEGDNERQSPKETVTTQTA